MAERLRIAFASGKGGAGKTTLAVNLAFTAAAAGYDSLYVDCDVEEPDGHIFLRPEVKETATVTVPIPVVDADRCDGCGRCGEICRFNAIKVLAGLVVTFPELCHSCGGCTLVCSRGAISESDRKIGRITSGVPTVFPGNGNPGRLGLMMGDLDVGQARGVPVIEKLAESIEEGEIVFFDAPPGTSCPMVAAVRHVDYVVLVAEASPFGLHDFELAAEAVSLLGIPSGAVINRFIPGLEGESSLCREMIGDLCRGRSIDILATLEADRKIAEISSEGGLAAVELPGFGRSMKELLDTIMKRAAVD